MSIQKVAFVANAARPDALRILAKLHAQLASRGVQGFTEEHVGHALNLPWATIPDLARSDLCVVLGGDGTLIHAAYVLGGNPVPLLGINLGSLGFLTEITEPEIDVMLSAVLAGDFELEPRMKLRVHLHRGAGSEKLLDAEVLNDAVINKGALAKIADLQCSIDHSFMTLYKADGVIVSTPTGSTAYSLSAAGPILYPTMNAVIVTPICPHTLTQRPIVVPDDREIELTLKSETAEMYLTLDGQTGVPLLPRDRVQIKQSKNKVMLIRNPKLDFFTILRTKLRWGGALTVRELSKADEERLEAAAWLQGASFRGVQVDTEKREVAIFASARHDLVEILCHGAGYLALPDLFGLGQPPRVVGLVLQPLEDGFVVRIEFSDHPSQVHLRCQQVSVSTSPLGVE